VDNYPGNSRRVVKVNTEPSEKPEEKKIESVVKGEVIRRKKPLGKRFLDTFIGGDAKGVAGYVLLEVLLPAAKDAVADAFSQGIEKMLFGEARSTGRRTGTRPGTGYTSYNRFAQSSRREDPRTISRQSRARHEFDEIILQTRVEAEEVIERLFDLVSQYEQATVADLYELVGVTGNYTDHKWGWTDIQGIRAVRITGGYLLDLPRPIALE
jgi:hypothetical protein